MWKLDYKESWAQRIDAFELWCWRRLLRLSWTARTSNQFILKKISPEYSLEGLMLKLKLQYFDHLMQRADSLEKTLMLGKIEGRRRKWWDGWMASPTRWTWIWVNSRSWWWTGRTGMLQSMGSQRVGHDWVTELTDCNINLGVFISHSLLLLKILIQILWPLSWIFKGNAFSLFKRNLLELKAYALVCFHFLPWVSDLKNKKFHSLGLRPGE